MSIEQLVFPYYAFNNPPPPELEKLGGESLVEPEGYIPAEQQIRGMMMAGMSLAERRKEMFDYEGGIGQDFDMDTVGYDPTRMPGVDPADISALRIKNEWAIRQQALDAKKKAEEDAEAAADAAAAP